jgi:ATP-dependent Clp protease adaptor protein ClpS
VINVLQKVFSYDTLKAYSLMHTAHTSGQCIIWSGQLEVAELKADQVRSCGPDPAAAPRGAQPLAVTVEPME